MNKVRFIIDKDLDFKNHLIGANVSKDAQGLSPDVIEYYKGLRDASDTEKKKIFLKKTSKFYSDEMGDIRRLLEKQTQEMWNLVEDRYIQKIEKIHDKTFPFKKISGVLTTAPFGYGYDFDENNPWFACSKDTPTKAVCTAMHEIMHAFFHKYFAEEYKKKFGLNDGQVWTVKEALTVLLNLEFDTIRMYPDKGHPGHEKLRNEVKKNWLKYRNLSQVLEKIVEDGLV